ncbi:MAG TPA: sialidase family protein, partial [Chryseosolibacter sp.]|nr:sialidase family protein [Chryseosolibacter sp.]
GTNAGVMRSTDKGVTWKMADPGMHFYDYGTSYPRNEHKFIPSVAKLTKDSFGNVYAVADRVGIFMSADGGATWSYVMEDRTRLYGVSAVTVNPQGILFAANSELDYRGYVYCSSVPVGQFQLIDLPPMN